MLLLLRWMDRKDVTVHGFRSSFRDWAAEEAGAPRELAEVVLAHQVGSDVERGYARSDLLDRRRALMESRAKPIPITSTGCGRKSSLSGANVSIR